MQVDRVQVQSSPSFGILRITPEAMPALKKASTRAIATIDRIGEQISGLKESVIELGKDMNAKIIYSDGTVFVGTFKPTKPNIWTFRNLIFDATRERNVKTGIMPRDERGKYIYEMPSPQHAVDSWKRMRRATALERCVELTKIAESNFDPLPKITKKLVISAQELYEKYKG